MEGRILWQSADGVYRAVGKSKAFTDPRAVASGIKIQVASNSIIANCNHPSLATCALIPLATAPRFCTDRLQPLRF